MEYKFTNLFNTFKEEIEKISLVEDSYEEWLAKRRKYMNSNKDNKNFEPSSIEAPDGYRKVMRWDDTLKKFVPKLMKIKEPDISDDKIAIQDPDDDKDIPKYKPIIPVTDKKGKNWIIVPDEWKNDIAKNLGALHTGSSTGHGFLNSTHRLLINLKKKLEDEGKPVPEEINNILNSKRTLTSHMIYYSDYRNNALFQLDLGDKIKEFWENKPHVSKKERGLKPYYKDTINAYIKHEENTEKNPDYRSILQFTSPEGGALTTTVLHDLTLEFNKLLYKPENAEFKNKYMDLNDIDKQRERNKWIKQELANNRDKWLRHFSKSNKAKTRKPTFSIGKDGEPYEDPVYTSVTSDIPTVHSGAFDYAIERNVANTKYNKLNDKDQFLFNSVKKAITGSPFSKLSASDFNLLLNNYQDISKKSNNGSDIRKYWDELKSKNDNSVYESIREGVSPHDIDVIYTILYRARVWFSPDYREGIINTQIFNDHLDDFGNINTDDEVKVYEKWLDIRDKYYIDYLYPILIERYKKGEFYNPNKEIDENNIKYVLSKFDKISGKKLKDCSDNELDKLVYETITGERLSDVKKTAKNNNKETLEDLVAKAKKLYKGESIEESVSNSEFGNMIEKSLLKFIFE